MFFQVNITPKEKKCQAKSAKESENQDPVTRYSMILAPFQPQTHITLESKISIPIQAFLTLKNINKSSLKLTVTKQPPGERNLSLSSTEFQLDGNSEHTLELTWVPLKAGVFRDTLEIADNRRSRYNITLNLTATDPKRAVKSRKALSKISTQSSRLLTTNSYNSRPVQPKPTDQPIIHGAKRSHSPTKPKVQPIVHGAKRSRSPTIFESDKENTVEETQPEESCKRIKKQNDPQLDFSSIVNSNFDLSVFDPKLLPGSSKTFTVTQTQTIRRETFDVIPVSNRQEIARGKSPNRNLDESDHRTETHSEFSFLVNQVNFSVVHTPKSNFSPQRCSTIAKTQNQTYNVTGESNQSSSFNSNATYDVTPNGSKSCAKLSLADTLEAISPINSEERPTSPFKLKSCSLKLFDQSSVKEVVEADLWTNSLAQGAHPPVHQNVSQLQKIIEEDSLNVTFVSPPQKRFKHSRPYKMEISPPVKPAYKAGVTKTISPRKKCKLTKEKLENTLKRKVQINKNTSASSLNIPGVKITRVSTAGIVRRRSDKTFKIDNKDSINQLYTPDPFAATTTEDPFLSSKVYYDAKWIHQQEIEFMKWLNALMTAPEHLSTDVDAEVIDIGKLWQSCRQKDDVVLAQTKETICARYHTESKLNTLRKAACAMYRNSEISDALNRTYVGIDKDILSVRKDRNLHKDIGLQKAILELFLSYNPLWLRISLETIYNQPISLHSNNDLVGLTRFLLARFFSDPQLIKDHSYSNSLRKPTFLPNLNKFILQKFFAIIYFLDYAKNHKLIGHDPCLFRKKSTIKDSRTILLTFTREVLSGIGDVTKVLRGFGYSVTHKQVCLDEYDYAVVDLSSDLRDGVKLCRAMEIIASQDGLVSRCRMPAHSKLQKVHNVDLALKALKTAGYELVGEIDAKSIVEGHREKTLSLLWQIIYKFQKPLFEKAATKVQRWWRAKLWYVRIRNFLKKRRELAATVIQKRWRSYLQKKREIAMEEERKRVLKIQIRAVLKIQKMWRLRKQRLREKEMERAATKIQKCWHNFVVTKPYVNELKRDLRAVTAMQQRWRARKQMKIAREEFLNLRQKTVRIQELRRANVVARKTRLEYLQIRSRLVYLQQKWRATKMAREERRQFLKQVQEAKRIQAWWRATLARNKERNNFIILKDAVRTVENHWIARSQMIQARKNFLRLKQKACVIQTAWRRFSATRSDREFLAKKKKAIVTLQSHWRGRVERQKFQKTKKSISKIQSWWRAILTGRSQRNSYKTLRNSCIVFQKNWKMLQQRRSFCAEKSAAMKIQRWYRNRIACRFAEKEFARSQVAVRKIQAWWSYTKLALQQKRSYLKLRAAAIRIQNRWRETVLAEKQRQQFLKEKQSAIKIQSQWRMIQQRRQFRLEKEAAVKVQKWWCQKLFMKRRIQACRKIQSVWRATMLMREQRNRFLELKKAVIKIQAYQRMVSASTKFTIKKEATKIIQDRWRATLEARKQRAAFLQMKRAAIKIQSYHRMRTVLKSVRVKLEALRKIQFWWRSVLLTKRTVEQYKALQTVAVKLQRRFRENRERRQIEAQQRLEAESMYRLHNAAAIIQAFWRGYQVRQRSCQQVTELRRRTVKTAKIAVTSSNTIANKVEEAATFLRNPNNVGQLLVCLCTLDTVTRLSPDSCILLCRMELAESIYEKLHLYNRSLPMKEVAEAASNILINLSKYGRTVGFVMIPEYSDILTSIMSATIEKQTDLFFVTATLFWILTNEPQYAAEVFEREQVQYYIKRMQTTLMKMRMRPSSERPSVLPDWNCNRSPRLFTNQQRALNLILENRPELN